MDNPTYLSRHLLEVEQTTPRAQIDERTLLAIPGPRVILGEPGMGKSDLIEELARLAGSEPVSALRFMLSTNPLRLVPSSGPLLIDALDEAMSRREGDAVDTVVAQLEAAGCPEVILSCRAREWQTRSSDRLREIYRSKPKVFAIQPLTREEALTLLPRMYPDSNALTVIEHLEKHRLEELYSNPLTLSMMGRVAESDKVLPHIRADLFERVGQLLWSEHNSERQESKLAQLDAADALDAAGALCASLLLSGGDALSVAGAAQAMEVDLRVAEVERLPNAKDARVVFTSKLFRTVGPNRAKPIHRVMAEYLGARWLSRVASTPRTQRRLLEVIQDHGAVPASLRGLHAWLAFHSPAMSSRVMTIDPYGVLRYGETSAMSATASSALLDGLVALANEDPYFRSEDWDSRTAAGLVAAVTRDRVSGLIRSDKTAWHLRSLLIEGLKNTSAAKHFASVLEEVVFSTDFNLRERSDAVEALLPLRDTIWWRSAVLRLRNLADSASCQLARSVIEDLACDVPDEILVATIFAEIGATISPIPKVAKKRSVFHHFGSLVDMLDAARIPSVLDHVAELFEAVVPSEWESTHDVGELVAGLVTRGIQEGSVSPKDAARLWVWLGIIEEAHSSGGFYDQKLSAALATAATVRRAVQLHVLSSNAKDTNYFAAYIDLGHRGVGLSREQNDLEWHLERFVGKGTSDESARSNWRALVQYSRGREGLSPQQLVLAKSFAGDDHELLDFIAGQQHSEKPEWQLRQEKREEDRRLAHAAQLASIRAEFDTHRSAVRQGAMQWSIPAAKAYLGLIYGLGRERGPVGRLSYWLGEELASECLVGFESYLRSADLPEPVELSAELLAGSYKNYLFVFYVGLAERHRLSLGFDGLSPKTLACALLLCHSSMSLCSDCDERGLTSALEAIVVPSLETKIWFSRLAVEPGLNGKFENIPGLYKVANNPDWQPAGAQLAEEWLLRYPEVPFSVEYQLVECLTKTNSHSSLRKVAAEKATRAPRTQEHADLWLAISFLVRFDECRSAFEGIGARRRLFIWNLRNVVGGGRRAALAPLAPAQLQLLVSEFRRPWPYATLEGMGSGDTNDYDATDFIHSLIYRLVEDDSSEAANALRNLADETPDGYTSQLLHGAAEQRQKRVENCFQPLKPSSLGSILNDGPPKSTRDMATLILEEMSILQAKVRGDDVDTVQLFWSDEGVPRDENTCRDRIAGLIDPHLQRYGVQRITEADMPLGKRADVAFQSGRDQIPMEVKGQWHDQVWDAAAGQLDRQYLIDWRSDGRGIYCVLWFGSQPSSTGRRLKVHPEGANAPSTPERMKQMVIERIPAGRRTFIDVVVLDLTKQA